MRTLALAAALAVAACDAPEAPPPPDVLLICLDTFRADHLGVLGYERDTGPFLSRLAREGTLFAGACSTSSWTAPATASLLTGLYPARHGVVRGFHAQKRPARRTGTADEITLTALAAGATTLAERFRDAGYRTFGIASNLNVCAELGLDRGFDRLETRDGESAEQLRARIVEWRGELDAEGPWFLYVHLNDTHHPYELRKPWFEGPRGRGIEHERALYDSEIGYVDDQLRLLFDDLEVGDDTLVAVVADHGEEFMEHGRRQHGMSLHVEVNRSLFFVRAPELGVAAQRVDFPVSLVDVTPTLLELAGLPVAEDDGRSLAALARGGPAGDLAQRTVFAHRLDPFGREGELWAAIDDGWKLIEGPDGAQLFDLQKDPGEHRDRAQREPEHLERLRAALAAFRAGAAGDAGQTTVREVDDELLERLEELGYTE